MFIATFENICGIGENINDAIDNFQEAYADYNEGENAAISDIIIHTVIKTNNIKTEYKLI